MDGKETSPAPRLEAGDEPRFDEVTEWQSELHRAVDIFGPHVVRQYFENQQRKTVYVPGYGGAIKAPKQGE